MAKPPLIGIIMGSRSDWETMSHAAEMLTALEVPHETRVVSAHRTPERLYDYAKSAAGRGLKVIIAGAGGAAHLPGMTAAMTRLPVLGVPVESKALKGMDSLMSIVQMPGGIPVGTLAIGKPGAINAALLGAAILATNDEALAERLDAWRAKQTAELLRASGLNFYGNVEGDDIYKGTTEIIVCDGFVGNVALKASEGLAVMLYEILKEEFTRNALSRLVALVAYPLLRAFKHRVDPRQFNGATLIGLKGVVVKSHGSADALAFQYALRKAYTEAAHGVLDKIAQRMATMAELTSNRTVAEATVGNV